MERQSPWPGGTPPDVWAKRIADAPTPEERRRIAGQVPQELRALVRSFLEVIAMHRRARARSGRRSGDLG